MSYLLGFVHFWYEFIVGDDWTVAIGVVLALIATAILVRFEVPAWWFMPVAVAFLLFGSLWRVTRQSH